MLISVVVNQSKEVTMSKQTSIEWLVPNILELTLQLSNKRISQRNCELKILELFQKAKQMHKEEIEDAYGDGINAYRVDFCNREEYYQETYGSSPKTSNNC